MMDDYYQPQGYQQPRRAQQDDLWAIPTTPPPQPLDDAPPITSAEMDAIIQDSRRPEEADWSATISIDPRQWGSMGDKKQGQQPTSATYGEGWGGRYYGG